MNAQLVELYLDAENDVKNNQYAEASRKYESIIYEEPGNPMAHNSIGWLYKTQLDDYRQAENHYMASIHSDPNHPHAYYNYAMLLFDLEKFEELDRFLKKMLRIPVLDKAWIYHRYGLTQELVYAFEDAICNYEKAILTSLNSDKIKSYSEDIERCNEKMQLVQKHTTWLDAVRGNNSQ